MRISAWSPDVCASDHTDLLHHLLLKRLLCAWLSGPCQVRDASCDRQDTVEIEVRLQMGRQGVERRLHLRVIRPAGGGARFQAAKEGGAEGVGGKEAVQVARSEEHTSELQSLMRISYAVFCLKNKN